MADKSKYTVAAVLARLDKRYGVRVGDNSVEFTDTPGKNTWGMIDFLVSKGVSVAVTRPGTKVARAVTGR